MLRDAPAKAFLGASDLDAACAYYEGVLGLEIVTHAPYHVVARAGGVGGEPPDVVAVGGVFGGGGGKG